MTTAVRVSLEAIDDNATVISQKLDLPTILSKLREKSIFSSEQLERLENPALTVIERTGYLLQCVKKLQQKGVDTFMEGLRETSSVGHREITTLLEETASEEPAPSPLLEVFESKRADILSRISFATFMSKMIEMDVVSVHENMEIYNPHRSADENCLALIGLLMKRPGAEGLLKFIECLHEDLNPEHKALATILLKEASSVVQEHPRRADILKGDKTQLLLLERWREVGTPMDVATKKAFKTHEDKLKKEVNVAVLLPLLVKKRVVTVEEEARLNRLRGEERAPQLVDMVGGKGMRSIVSFVECIKQSPEHERLARTFEIAAAKRIPAKPATEKTSKLAVMVTMDTYLHMENDYEAKEKKMYSYNPDFEEYRENLQVCLERLEFTVIDFTEIISQKNREGMKSPTAINTLFDREVASRCNKDAIVFIYICGHQFPLKVRQGSKREDVSDAEERYSGAVLLDGASELSRRSSECIDMSNLKYWVELLPTDYVTFLIDCHHSHVVRYGKQRLPSEVEIMTNPWSSLTGSPGVVLYFCQPDPEAMWRLRGEYSEDDSVFGKLTEIFVKALISWIRRGHKMEVSHRLFYESISFHWHKKGRVHKLFVPAIQGDVDRSFLGTSSFPYLQVLRADLVRSDVKDGLHRYDLTKLQVATGTQLGLIKDDELVVSHILHPEVKVRGRIMRAHPLSSIAEILKDDREKFSRLLDHTYEEEKVSEDGSTEFVLVKKKFPFHLRDNYSVICQDVPESDKETIKNYINSTSHLLSYAPNIELARLLVRKRGQFFSVEDREMKRDKDGKKTPANDILFQPRVKTIQNIKSVLEIMAWFKHVKNLRTQTDLNHFLCYLVCEKPLLTPSSSPTDEYQIRASSQMGEHRANEAILQFSDDPHFWCPQPKDHDPTLEVEFSENRVVTAVEVRGDPDTAGHITQADLNYRKLVFHTVCQAPQPKQLATIAMETNEKACFVVFKPVEWDRGSDFCIAVRLVASTPGHERGRAQTQGVSSLTLMYWNFLNKSAGWTISPEPTTTTERGHAVLDLSRTENMLRWSGRTAHPMTFELSKELLVEKIEIACVPGTKPLKMFRVELCSQWFSEPLPPFPSTWPCKQELRKPLVISNLQLCPGKWSELPFRAQLQIYGNTHEKKVVVEEQDILQLQFVNYTKQNQFVYLYYLEETGKIEIVMADTVGPQAGLKKLIRVHIPKGYDPVAKKITDQYRVVVSPKKVFLEPLNQLGLHEYLGVRSYNPCYIGRRTDIGKDEQWNEYKFEIVVKKGTSRALS